MPESKKVLNKERKGAHRKDTPGANLMSFFWPGSDNSNKNIN